MSNSPSGPQKALEDLIAQFEEEVRKRPTPDEVAEAEKARLAALEATATDDPAATTADRPTAPVHQPEPEVSMAPAPPAQAPAALSPDVPRVPPAPAPPVTAAPAPEIPPVPAGVQDLRIWWAGGERIELALAGGVKRTIFVRVIGTGPWLTMIHGFPTSSWDWAAVVPALARRYRLLTFDLLGFGDSDKPPGHDWSAFEQADIVEALWRHLGVTETRVVAHDVGMTVSLELLARQEEGKLTTRMVDYTLLNGGVYAGFHRPRRVQVLLQKPVIGFLVARMMSQITFGKSLAEVFAPEHKPTPEQLRQHWESVTKRNGAKNYHRLIKYIPERRANKERWESALEKTSLPICFVWGMADPVSGAHMIEVIRERRPGADIIELEDVGHYPQLEAPVRVAAAIIKAPRRAPTD